MNNDRPVVLLDVDGVLNAMPGPRAVPHDSWPDWKHSSTGGFPLWTSKRMASEIASLGEVHWLTTWNEDNMANLAISPLVGIGPFPVAASPSDRLDFGDELWKPRTAANYANKYKCVVWIDDEAKSLWKLWDGGRAPSNMLIISPKPSDGFTDIDLEWAKLWLANRGRP